MRELSLKLDENLGLAPLAMLRQLGYPADRVHEEGLSRAPDDVVWRRIGEEGRFFITLDLGFADARRFPPGSHPGVLIPRPRTKGRNAVLEILGRLLKEHALEDFKGCLVIADERHIRIRRPPAPREIHSCTALGDRE